MRTTSSRADRRSNHRSFERLEDRRLLSAAFGFAIDLGPHARTAAVAAAGADVVVAGELTGPVDFDPGPGVVTRDGSTGFGFVAKYTAAGSLAWMAQFPAVVASVAADAAGNVVAAGTFTTAADFDPGAGVSVLTPPAAGGAGAFVVRLTSAGAFNWAAAIADISAAAVSSQAVTFSTYDDQVFATAAGREGIAVVGLRDGSQVWGGLMVTGPAGQANVSPPRLVMDTAGGVLFASDFLGPLDWGLSSTREPFYTYDAAGNVVSTTTVAQRDVFVARRLFNGPVLVSTLDLGYDDRLLSLTTGPGGDVYAAVGAATWGPSDTGAGVFFEQSTQDYYVTRLTPGGGERWSRKVYALPLLGAPVPNELLYGGTAVASSPNAYLYAAVGTRDAGGRVLRIAPDGTTLWTAALPPTTGEALLGFTDLAVGATGRIYSTGTIVTGTVDVDPGAGVAAVTGAGFLSALVETQPIVGVTTSNPVMLEVPGGGGGSFTVSRAGPADADLIVRYAVNGRATNGVDYQKLSGTLTIPAGQPTALLPVAVIDDTVAEPDEDVWITILASPAYAVDPFASSARSTIVDNDADTRPQIRVSAQDPSAAEPSDGGTFAFTRVSPAGLPPLTVRYAVNGTAANGADYVRLTGTVTFAAWDEVAYVPLVPIDDAAVEDAESVWVTILSDPSYAVDPARSSARVDIADDDNTQAPPVISVTAPAPAAAEPATPGLFRFARTGPATADLVVRYAVNGRATNGLDYAKLFGTVVIAAGQTAADVPLVVTDDTLREGAEDVWLTVLAASSYAVDPAHSSAKVTIADND